MTPWLMVLLIVASTTASDLLQSSEMKRHGVIDDFRPVSALGKIAQLFQRPRLLLSIVFMAVSFFAFLQLLSMADLSFAVPATALGLVVETVLAQIILKERVDRKRWAGALLVAGGVALLAV